MISSTHRYFVRMVYTFFVCHIIQKFTKQIQYPTQKKSEGCCDLNILKPAKSFFWSLSQGLVNVPFWEYWTSPYEFRSGEPPKSRIRVGFGFRVSGFGFRRLKPTFAVGFGFLVSGFDRSWGRYKSSESVSGFGFRVSGFVA